MVQTTNTDKAVERGKKKPFEWIGFLQKFGVFIFLLLLIIFFASQNPRFLSIRNLLLGCCQRAGDHGSQPLLPTDHHRYHHRARGWL
jgi:hypothetical protein